MRTIGRKRPKTSPFGDYETFCGHCGTAYYRSKLFLDEAGILTCPEEGQGLDVIAAERANFEMTRVFERSDHDGPEDPPNTDVAPDMAALCEAPTGENFS